MARKVGVQTSYLSFSGSSSKRSRWAGRCLPTGLSGVFSWVQEEVDKDGNRAESSQLWAELWHRDPRLHPAGAALTVHEAPGIDTAAGEWIGALWVHRAGHLRGTCRHSPTSSVSCSNGCATALCAKTNCPQ